MMEKAEIAGYFTDHSARRTGGTHLFQVGIDRKLRRLLGTSQMLWIIFRL